MTKSSQNKTPISKILKNVIPFFDTTTDLIALSDKEGTILWANKSWKKTFGSVFSEGQNPFSLLHPQDAPGLIEKWNHVVTGKVKCVTDEYRLKFEKDKYRRFFTSMYPVEIEQKKRFYFVTRDITDLKQAEEALKESEQKHKLLFNTSKDALMTLNPPEWKFSKCNPATINMFDVKDEAEFVSLGPWELSPEYQPDGKLSSEKAKEMIDFAMKKGSNYFEWKHKKYKGPEFSATVLLSKIDEGNGAYLQATVRDVTELKKMEAELIKARNKAQESDRLKTAFLSSISHEIRTPLNHMSMCMGIIKSSIGKLNKTQNEYFGLLKSSETSLLNLLNDIVDISLIDQGQIKLNNVDFSLSKIMEELFKYYSQTFEHKKKGLKLVLETSENININADSERLKQVLSNLLNNAFKFCEKGNIKFGVLKKNKHTLEFYVQDEGIGIPKDKQDSMFNKFVQLDVRTTREYKGLGLGLAISKSLIEIMGGNIGVKSRKGKGAKFYFTLPYVSGENISDSKSPAQITNKSAFTGKTVLIAEDDIISFKTLQFILEVEGIKVKHAINGETAVELAKTEAFDAILMDVSMPIMDGLEATKRIKQYDSSIPIIAMTGLAMKGDKERILKAGCDNYISKPADAGVVLEKLSMVLN